MNRFFGLSLCLVLLGLIVCYLYTRDRARFNPAEAADQQALLTSQPKSEKIPEEPRKSDPTTIGPIADSASTHSHNFAAIRAALRRDSESLEVVERNDGSMYVNLEGRYRSASMARRLPDGSLEVVCFENFAPAKEFLLNTGNPATAHEHANCNSDCTTH